MQKRLDISLQIIEQPRKITSSLNHSVESLISATLHYDWWSYRWQRKIDDIWEYNECREQYGVFTEDRLGNVAHFWTYFTPNIWRLYNNNLLNLYQMRFYARQSVSIILGRVYFYYFLYFCKAFLRWSCAFCHILFATAWWRII